MRGRQEDKVRHLESHLRQEFPLLSDKPLLLETIRATRAKINEEICRPGIASRLRAVQIIRIIHGSYIFADTCLGQFFITFCQI
jgi:hypothetical protein